MIPYRAAPALLLATCAALGAGCKKEKESLVLADLRLAAADPAAMDLASVKLVATPGREASFDKVTMLSATEDTEVGLYLPGDVTGTVRIVATAYPRTGCAGFRGMNDVTIASAGVTQTVSISMNAADVCPTDGGAAGTNGTGGAGGGTGGATGGYPSIAACRPFYHSTTNCPSVYVNSVAISPNGQLVATGGDSFDGRIKIWSFDGTTLTATGTELTEFNGYTVAFSPDGTRLAYTSNPSISSAVIRTYMVPTWTAGPTLQDNGSGNTLRGVAFTPDSLRVVSVNAIGTAGGDVFVHSVASGAGTAPVYTAHIANEPYGMAVLGPKATTTGSVGVAVGGYNGTVTLLSLTSTGFANPVTLPASTSTRTTYTVEFSPDGSLLATGESFGAVRFWNNPPEAAPVPVGSAISFAGGDSVNDIAFSPNGAFLAVGGAFSSTRLSIYSVATHAELVSNAPSADVVSLVFSPNGGALIAGLDDCGTVLVCN